MELELEIVGPLSVDMLIAGLLDTFPRYESRVLESIDAVSESYPVECRLEYVNERGVTGRSFIIEPYTLYFGNLWVQPVAEREGWSNLRRVLTESSLPTGVARHALAMLASPVRHQAARHDINLDDVTFAKQEGWRILVEAVALAVILDGLVSARWIASRSGNDCASDFGRAVLDHLGVHAYHDDEPSRNIARPILISGIGFSAARSQYPGCHMRINVYDALGADHTESGGRRPGGVGHPQPSDERAGQESRFES